MKRRIIGGTIGFFALPALIPGAGVGLAAGGTAIGMSEPIQGAIGGAIGFLSGSLGNDPEAGDQGVVLQVAERLSGNNVLVRWTMIREGKDVVVKEFWHNPGHLIPQ